MNSNDFTYWLKGFFELTNTEELTKEQVVMIKEHLDLCFNKVTHRLGELQHPSTTNRNLSQIDWTWRPENEPFYSPNKNDLNRIICSNNYKPFC